jgi:hypothetical protein
MCYGSGAFPAPYTDSNANTFQVFFGADNAADYMKPLWGDAHPILDRHLLPKHACEWSLPVRSQQHPEPARR